MDQQLQAIVTILALVNPAMCVAIFQRGTKDQPRSDQIALATKAAVTIVVILVLAALFGEKILHAFGVSLDAFSVAGGGVLAVIGIGMLRDKSNEEKLDKQPADANPQSALTPLILFAASPGTITGVITLAVSHSKSAIPVTALVAVGVATAVMWLVIVMAVYMGGKSSSGGFVKDTVTRFMGLIVIAMGVQFVLTGIKAFMAG